MFFENCKKGVLLVCLKHSNHLRCGDLCRNVGKKSQVETTFKSLIAKRGFGHGPKKWNICSKSVPKSPD